MNGKKILSSILACSILLSQSAVAFAADISTGTSDVTLIKTSRVGEDGGDEGPSIVQVKVPSEIPISQDEDGVSTVADNLAVQNLSQDTDIEVTGINVTGKNGWQIIDYSDDISMETEGTKKLGLEFRGDGTTSTGDFDITDGNWDVQADSSIQLNAKAKLPLQGDEYDTKQSIATVTWRVAISADQGSEDGGNEEQPPVEHEGAITNNWDGATKLLPTGSKGVKFSWDSTDKDATITEVKSSDPEVATITPSALNSLAEMPFSGTADYTVTALKKGTTTVTATLSSGEQTQFNVNVYELSNNTGSSGSNEIEITVPGDGFETGDDLSDSDITIEIPVTTPDGGDDVIEIKPEIPDGTELQPGDNEIEVEVEVDGVVIKITIVIRVESSNPSDGLTQTVEDAQAMGFTFSSYEDGLQIDSFENKQFKSEINVPEQIGDFKVLKIGTGVFKNQTNLKKITLPSTVTEIGESAFSDCINLSEIVAPGEMVEIGNDAFDGCSILTTKIRTSENEPVSIAQSAFDDCSEITLYVGETLKPYTWSANSGVKHLYYRDESFIADKVFTDYKTAAYLASATQTADVFVYGLSDLVEIPKSSCNNGQVYQDDELNFIDYKTTYEGGLGEIKTPYYTNGAKIGSYVSGYDTEKCIRFYVGEGTYPVLYSDINYDSDTMYIKPASGSSDPVEIHMVGSYDAPERVDTFFANVIIETDDGHRYLNGYEISGYTIIDAPIQIDFAWGYSYEIRVANINTNEYSSDNIEVVWLANDDIMNTTSTNRFWMGNDVKYFTISGTPTNVVSSRGQFVVMYRDEANKVISYAKYLERGISYSYKNTVTTSTNTSYNYDPLP